MVQQRAWGFQEAGEWVVAGPAGSGHAPTLAGAQTLAEQICGRLDVQVVAVPTLSRSVEVAADPRRVWDLVSDLPRMGEFSQENSGGRWLGAAAGPVVGARFAGRNRRGWRRWGGHARVTVSEPGRTFAFEVNAPPPVWLPLSRWTYAIEPTQGGCRLTETWELRVGRVMRVVGPLVTGESDRIGYTEGALEHTLQAVRQCAEHEADH